MDKGTQNYLLDHMLAGTNPSVLVDETKSAKDGLKTAHTKTDDEFNTSSNLSSSDDTKKEIKLEDLSKLMQNVDVDFMDLDSPENDRLIIVQEDDEEEVMMKKMVLKSVFESLRGGFPSRWESVGFCPIDASIRGWQGLPSGSPLYTNDECDIIKVEDASIVVMVKVKEIDMISNMYHVCCNKGFDDIKIHHIGGLWVWIQFNSEKSCVAFKSNESLKKLWITSQEVSPSFVVDERMIWIEIYSLPLCE
ncbi:hypothetical protein Tco_1070253 [Tanacetum coccineum]|uniref:DUF4283 domain-containing protein n=1 Tax=Tanacetum coccineum TaxID=301880 RepID=A0ABQ5HKW8_9ASTR